ncbi:hypothetical protein [Actinomadura atramentaria]|uniref:hypothetical protein n=1 Tax=Actinomadura atramentaria TaxID=1990 RepID=UPI000368E9AB|nr:hypothetical protein [Actinomadura atramentaria]
MTGDPIAELNREEWKDVPYSLELRGGHKDGERIEWHELPTVFRVPMSTERPEVSRFPLWMLPPLDPTRPHAYLPDIQVADYRRTYQVTDDGAHVYELWD